jgi:hypothetical protein
LNIADKNANPTQLVAEGYTLDNELPERKKDSLFRGYKPGGYSCRFSVIQYDGREPSPSLFQPTHQSQPPSAAFVRATPPSARGVLGSPVYVLVYRFAKRPAINEALAVFSMERVHRQLAHGINMPIPEALHEAFLTGVKPGLAEYMALTGKPYPLAELHSMIQSTEPLSLEQSSNPGNESTLDDILDFNEAFKDI